MELNPYPQRQRNRRADRSPAEEPASAQPVSTADAQQVQPAPPPRSVQSLYPQQAYQAQPVQSVQHCLQKRSQSNLTSLFILCTKMFEN